MNKITNLIQDSDTWTIFNGFFLGEDIHRLRKFLVKHNLFKETLDVPGHIVELGVFKGAGFAQLLKLREIYIPGTEKKVYGFDFFENIDLSGQTLNDNLTMEKFYNERDLNTKDGVSKHVLNNLYKKMNLSYGSRNIKDEPFKLIDGDVLKTIPEFLKQNTGFRISFLLFDMDMYKPTLESLNLLYDKVVRGGVIIFDEYGCDEWGESDAVDEWLKSHPEITLKTSIYGNSPTAYFFKK